MNFAKFLRKHLFSRTCLGDCFYLLLCNAHILSCLGSIWFGTRLCYSLNPYMHLYYLWSISIVKVRGYLKYFILCLLYFYSERPPLSKIFYSMCGLLERNVTRDFGRVSQIRLQFLFRQNIRKQYYGLLQESL